jgi:hypothetical protein
VTVTLTIPDEPVQALANGFIYIDKHQALILHMGGPYVVRGPAPSTMKTAVTVEPADAVGVIYQWTAVPVHAGISINSPTQLNTAITFATHDPGTYTFQLTAIFDGMTSAGVLSVTIPETHAPRITMPSSTINVP